MGEDKVAALLQESLSVAVRLGAAHDLRQHSKCLSGVARACQLSEAASLSLYRSWG